MHHYRRERLSEVFKLGICGRNLKIGVRRGKREKEDNLKPNNLLPAVRSGDLHGILRGAN